ncbi:UDP binding domain-containing protein [Bacillus mesophilus]|uniref:UDP binding domain-containing protein n=1 Tax=Bacillus mesophilus TaxID=1808955 RepID=UPI001969F569|nr:UDP binding domain-containing protein [Bacillus mesophilus]
MYQADIAFIVTEWDEIKNLSIKVYEELMKRPILFDGRNCYPLHLVEQHLDVLQLRTLHLMLFIVDYKNY